MTAYQHPQRLRQSEDEMVVGCRQQLALPLFQPIGGVIGTALGTVAIAAGVITVMLMFATLTAQQMTTHGFGTTGGQIRQGAPVTGRQTFAKTFQIGGPERSEDLG